MNAANATALPLVALPQPYWYRCVDRRYAQLAPGVSTTRTRFNDGRLRVLYFAPDARIAMFEARALLGSFFHAALPAAGVRHTVVRYRVDLGPGCRIANATESALPQVQTTVQEMTGDWFTYPRCGVHAPTQELAEAIFRRPENPMGLLAPSARNPLANNLVLFPDRLPKQSIQAAP